MNRGCQESKPINPKHQSTVKLNFCWWVDDQLRSLTNEFIAEGSSSWSSTEAETRIWKSSHQNVRQFDLLPSSFVASQVFFCWSLFWVFVFLASILLTPMIHLEVSRLLKDLYKHYRQCGFNSMLPTLILGGHVLESERRYARSKGMEPPDATRMDWLDMQLISADIRLIIDST